MVVPALSLPDRGGCDGGFSGMATDRNQSECPSWFPTKLPSSSSLILLVGFESLQMQLVASRDDVPCPQSPLALRQKESVLGFLQLGPTLVTDFLHSLHSPSHLIKERQS